MKRVKYGFLPCVLLPFLLFTGCCKKPPSTDPCTSLKTLQGLAKPGPSKLAVSALRAQALRDAALSVGAQGGLACRASEINQIFLKNETLLFRVFNFNSMVLDKNVLPPVLLEARNTLSTAGTDVLRISDRNYQIISQAKFVTAPPTWRDYLWMQFGSPELPDKSLLPRNQAEKLLWKRYVTEGWGAGIQQANTIFRENISRLKRDYEGMIRYRTLLAQNIVSPPFVAKMEMGITGGGSNMSVNDRLLRITAFPALQPESELWKTEIVPYE